MRELPEQQTPTTFAMFFGQELRRYRTTAGLSQEQLGAKINYTGTFIGLIEQAKRSCPQHVAERSDEILDARGALLSLWSVVNDEVHPAWFQPFIRAEGEAVIISAFQPLVISGVLQTEDYATEVIGAGRPEATGEEIRRDVVARMDRHAILERENPPRYWLILGETALRQVVGSRKIMFDQLAAVLEASRRPRVTIQVLPFSAGAHAALGGALTLLEGTHRTAYCEGHASGRLITDSEEVAECAHAFNLLQSTALNLRTSLDLIREAMEGYGP